MSFNQLQANVLCYKNVKFSNYEEFSSTKYAQFIPKFNMKIVIYEFDFCLYFKIFQELKALFLFLILNFPQFPKGTVSYAIPSNLGYTFS